MSGDGGFHARVQMHAAEVPRTAHVEQLLVKFAPCRMPASSGKRRATFRWPPSATASTTWASTLRRGTGPSQLLRLSLAGAMACPVPPCLNTQMTMACWSPMDEAVVCSFGAASWLVQQPGGNIMFDAPRYSPQLAKQLKVTTIECLCLIEHPSGDLLWSWHRQLLCWSTFHTDSEATEAPADLCPSAACIDVIAFFLS